jgi:hypothetical protein
MVCTCPHHVHRNAFCKHMAAVENATDDGTLDAFPSEDNTSDVEEAEPAECNSVRPFAMNSSTPGSIMSSVKRITE